MLTVLADREEKNSVDVLSGYNRAPMAVDWWTGYFDRRKAIVSAMSPDKLLNKTMSYARVRLMSSRNLRVK